MKRSRALIGITAAAAATMLAAGPTATAGTVSDPIAEGLSGPLQLTFDANDRPLVAQAFGPGTVSKVKANGDLATVVSDMSGSISGVAVRNGNIAYTLAGGGGPMLTATDDADAVSSSLRGVTGDYQQLKLQDQDGDQRVIANLGQAEANRNPDAHQVYGWVGYLQSCGEAAPEGHEPREGLVESNPHSVAAAPGGGWYVADAAANVLWKVKDGKIRVVEVFKPRSVTITEEMATDYGLDPCTIGTRYNFEPVPTDVEVAPSGALFVSLLPGEGNGPGTPMLDGTGAVTRVNPATGRSRVVADGFTGATNLALAPNRIYVAELFAGRVSQVNTRTGNVRPIAYMSAPAGLEQHEGTLYVTDIDAGTLSMIDPTGPTPLPTVD